MANEQTCPRRFTDMGPWRREERADRWENRTGLAGGIGPSCSFCGSLHPDIFMNLLEQGWELGPTDKTYKAYLHEPPAESTKDQTASSESGAARAKFYYQHLSDTQRAEFIDLLNAGWISIGYPGHLYVLPFFTKAAEAPSA